MSVNAAAVTGPVTLDEFATLQNSHGYEVIDGMLRYRRSSLLANVCAARISHQLLEYSFSHGGEAFGSDIELAIDPSRSQSLLYRADGAFVSKDRMAGAVPNGDFLRIPPELVVEVVTPFTAQTELTAKIKDYFRLGVRLVWVVYPDLKVVNVFTSDASLPPRVLSGQRLEGGDILPGLSIEVDFIFRTPSA